MKIDPKLQSKRRLKASSPGCLATMPMDLVLMKTRSILFKT